LNELGKPDGFEEVCEEKGMNELEAIIISRCRKSQTPRQMYRLLSMNWYCKRTYNYVCSIMSRLASERKLTKTRMGKFVYYRATDSALRTALNFIWKPIDDRINRSGIKQEEFGQVIILY